MNDEAKICCFCGSRNLKKLYSNLYHPFNKENGPFSFYKCLSCSSGLTFPLPSLTQLKQLYESFDGGMIPYIREIRDKNPLTKWYKQCITNALKRLHSKHNQSLSWMDVGSGNGELSALMSEIYPSSLGLAVDFHSVPALLQAKKNVSWLQTDLNAPSFKIPRKFDLIFLVTVLEHVLYPDVLVSKLLPSLNKHGVLYITVPDFGSVASKFLKRKWPYILPGEHLFIPSKRGVTHMLDRLYKQEFPSNNFDIEIKSIILPYSAGYYLNYFGFKNAPPIFSKITIGFPTGLLEASLKIT